MTREQRIAAHVLSRPGGTNALAARASKVSVRQVQRWKVEVPGFLDALDGADGMVVTIGRGQPMASTSQAEYELPELDGGEIWMTREGEVLGSRLPANPEEDATVCLTVVGTVGHRNHVLAELHAGRRPQDESERPEDEPAH
jgi:hypothetical protein